MDVHHTIRRMSTIQHTSNTPDTYIVYTQCTHINCTHNNISPSSTLTGSLRPLLSHRLRPLPDPSGPFLHKIQTPIHTHPLLVSPRIWINKTTLTSSIKNCHPHTCMLITSRVNIRVIIEHHMCPHYNKSLTHIKYDN